MIENFTLDTDANPENMNKLIRAINENSSAIGQIATKSFTQKGVISDNLDNIIDPGNYLCSSTCINLPVAGNGNLKAFRPIPDNLNHITQLIDMFSGTTALGTFIRNKFSGTWTPWKEISLIDKRVADIPLLNGWQTVSGGTGCYAVVKDNVVQIEIMMSNTSQPVANEIANLNTLIGGGANPSRNVFFTSFVRGVGYVGDGYINPLGSIYFGTVPPNIAGKQVVIKANYIR